MIEESLQKKLNLNLRSEGIVIRKAAKRWDVSMDDYYAFRGNLILTQDIDLEDWMADLSA